MMLLMHQGALAVGMAFQAYLGMETSRAEAGFDESKASSHIRSSIVDMNENSVSPAPQLYSRKIR